MKNDYIKNKRYAWAEINLTHLDHNINIIKSYAKSRSTRVMAVVKANAYGHGAVEISKQAVKSGAYALGVALVEEGIELRKAGINVPVYVLGESPAGVIEEAVEHNLILGVNSFESAQFISKECGRIGREAAININIDTGMNRIGIDYNHAVEQVLKISALPGLKLESVSTHYSCASGSKSPYTELQWKRFEEAIKRVRENKIAIKFFHCANSAAFFRHTNMHLDMVRTGISIYGLNPYDRDCNNWLGSDVIEIISGLKPVFSLKTRITFIKNVPRGVPISYCGTFRTKRDSIIATVPLGYADGYSRLLSNRAVVLVKGETAPVVGNITMDQFMIDITDIIKDNDIIIGDDVTLIGASKEKSITADDIAELMGTINYEVVCMFKNRIPRIYI